MPLFAQATVLVPARRAVEEFNVGGRVMDLLRPPASLEDLTGLSRDVPAESSHAPNQSSSYLTHCASLLGKHCGDEVFSAIIFGNKTVSGECCNTLVNDVGKQCHDDMTKYILTLKKSPKNVQLEILKRSHNVWNECVFKEYLAPEPVAELNDDNLY
ncbi:hypothetical protein Fmac_031705 [Flemingia macrophylla]|uniref:Prolamin-like domain-containing protein n=1 Tax=Flemingia macrophylla TaxID=520843 RepID=A0ABD1L2U0_9FABA